MLRILTVAAALTATTAFAVPAAQAAEAPWCAVIDVGPGNAYWDCQYRSFEACRRQILAGNRGVCNQNPRYGYRERSRYRSRRDYDYDNDNDNDDDD